MGPIMRPLCTHYACTNDTPKIVRPLCAHYAPTISAFGVSFTTKELSGAILHPLLHAPDIKATGGAREGPSTAGHRELHLPGVVEELLQLARAATRVPKNGLGSIKCLPLN